MVTKNEGIAALVLNVFVPGLGTVIWGDRKVGIFQLVGLGLSYLLMLVLIGFVTYFAVWVWAIVTGVDIMKGADSPVPVKVTNTVKVAKKK